MGPDESRGGRTTRPDRSRDRAHLTIRGAAPSYEWQRIRPKGPHDHDELFDHARRRLDAARTPPPSTARRARLVRDFKQAWEAGDVSTLIGLLDPGAVAAVLLTITDQGACIPLVDAVIDAVPASWWTDDPDYVDSFYALARETAGSRVGAAGNARMTVERYYVSAL
ncbi:hypothetical protein GCM10017667_44910 [Streptomyces filamentosus]|uniref:Uncharacterized protein n=1 Tax=Streptomyces filamentosus TaxID=67294 RepID=A0A919EPY2_STRFL|nr:hypothetical protein GCM10017667_44910 [Streptomyces filamentosus]